MNTKTRILTTGAVLLVAGASLLAQQFSLSADLEDSLASLESFLKDHTPLAILDPEPVERALARIADFTVQRHELHLVETVMELPEVKLERAKYRGWKQQAEEERASLAILRPAESPAWAEARRDPDTARRLAAAVAAILNPEAVNLADRKDKTLEEVQETVAAMEDILKAGRTKGN